MINTVTLNPAMDKIIKVGEFNLNCMNRIRETIDCIGGKGTHIAYNLSLLGVENRTFGISFGETGKKIIKILEDCGAQTEYIWHEKPESRTNYLLIDQQKNCTFIAEAGKTLDASYTDELLALIEQNIAQQDVLVIAGDASNVEDKELQKKLLELTRRFDMRLYLDSSGDFMKKAIEYRPYMIKPNMEELAELAGFEVKTQSDVVAALEKFPAIPMAMVSMGGDGWVFRYEGRLYRGHGLKVPIQNTAGCGDALLSALIYQFEYTDSSVVEKLAFASAIATSCAMTEMTIGFDAAVARQMEKDIKIEEIIK